MSKELVKYSNKMNTIPLEKFSTTDLNFFYTICSQVRDKGTELVELEFDTIKQLSGFKPTSNKRFIEELQRMNDKLLKCIGHLETEESIDSFTLFSTFRILKTKPILKVRVNVDYLDFFNNLVSEFTQFELEQYVGLDGKYAKNLYRLLKQWRRNGHTQKYSVEELKELLNAPDYAPKIMLRDIINPAIEEIRKKKTFPNLWVEIVYAKKRGKPVEGYIFHFGKEEIPGQVSIETLEDGKYMPTKNTAVKKTKRTTRKKNSFNNFTEREYTKDEMDELERKLLEK